MAAGAGCGSLPAFIAGLAPRHPQYEAMHQSLLALVADSRPWPQMTGSGSLRPGEWSNDIGALREILQRTGMLENLRQYRSARRRGESFGEEKSSPRRGVYDRQLVEGVKRSGHAGLGADGVIGQSTRDWLNVSSAQRAGVLALNIQRLRLLPGKLSTGIMVNIPAFSAGLLPGRRSGTGLAVIVRTSGPQDADDEQRAEQHGGQSAVERTAHPGAQRYSARKGAATIRLSEQHGYTVMRGWNSKETIDPYRVDWSTITENNLPFRFQQAPGARNSLGRYKFNMPSSDAIYLHDTPNHNLFQKDVRALSSGCVRVNKASELANMLLQDAGWNDTRISDALKQGGYALCQYSAKYTGEFILLNGAFVDADGL